MILSNNQRTAIQFAFKGTIHSCLVETDFIGQALGHPRGAQSTAAAPPHGEEPAEVVHASGQEASWMFPRGGVSSVPIWEETRDMLERLYLSPSLWPSLLRLLHVTLVCNPC